MAVIRYESGCDNSAYSYVPMPVMDTAMILKKF